jgi:hypothetical protein
MWSFERLSTYQSNFLPTLVTCFAYYSALQAKTICSFETSGEFHQNTRRFTLQQWNTTRVCCNSFGRRTVPLIKLPDPVHLSGRSRHSENKESKAKFAPAMCLNLLSSEETFVTSIAQGRHVDLIKEVLYVLLSAKFILIKFI